MTKRDAPLTFFGNGLPAGSAVFLKSRFLLYSSRAISTQPNHGSVSCTRSCRGPRRVVSAYLNARRLTQTPPQHPLSFAGQRLANEIADKAADHDVLAQLRNFGFDEV